MGSRFSKMAMPIALVEKVAAQDDKKLLLPDNKMKDCFIEVVWHRLFYVITVVSCRAPIFGYVTSTSLLKYILLTKLLFCMSISTSV
ncbi:hypothetical protein Lalb_Chr17g0345021 [Lupinus albus]|uniref:Uncharacterized protein n=1 Tax=Lupinus albus TaxID=3870 RepID=A0A6A4P6H4_LUPAL|nr:hypothetical protein Lalb_Chr17g0345021 [Lupinus albus]